MVTELVRRPRTKPPVTLPQRAEYDGRAGQSIESILSEQPDFGFLRFGAGAVGWQYGGHVEEWRRCFAKKLENFIAGCMSETEKMPEEAQRWLSKRNIPLPFGGVLSGIWNMLAFYGIKVRKLPGEVYALPFGLSMVVSSESLHVTDAAHEYARGTIVQGRDWLFYIIIGPIAQKGSKCELHRR